MLPRGWAPWARRGPAAPGARRAEAGAGRCRRRCRGVCARAAGQGGGRGCAEGTCVGGGCGCAGGGRHARGLLLCGPAPCMSLGARRVGASLALQGWVCVAGPCRAPRAEPHLCGGARGFVTSPAQDGSLLAGCLAPLRVEVAGSLSVRAGLSQRGKLRHGTSPGMVGKGGFPIQFWEPVLPM